MVNCCGDGFELGFLSVVKWLDGEEGEKRKDFRKIIH